jgi:leader peptidase (prepilin peptidase)/N-methyltransferase
LLFLQRHGVATVSSAVALAAFFLATGLIYLSLKSLVASLIAGLCASAVGFAGAWDWHTRTIPNLVSLGAIPFALALHPLMSNSDYQVTPGDYLSPVAGGLVAFGIFFSVYLFNRKKLGGGDVKLATLIGVMCGFPGTLIALGMGMVLAVISMVTFRKARGYVLTDFPLGPHLALATVVYLCFISSRF